MRFKDVSHMKPRSLLCQYIDTISYNGHAIQQYKNRIIEQRMRDDDKPDGEHNYYYNTNYLIIYLHW
jgi:hypothetical protein